MKNILLFGERCYHNTWVRLPLSFSLVGWNIIETKRVAFIPLIILVVGNHDNSNAQIGYYTSSKQNSGFVRWSLLGICSHLLLLLRLLQPIQRLFSGKFEPIR